MGGCRSGERILNLRAELTAKGLDAGPATIAWHLETHHQLTVSVATIRRRLLAAGLIEGPPQVRSLQMSRDITWLVGEGGLTSHSRGRRPQLDGWDDCCRSHLELPVEELLRRATVHPPYGDQVIDDLTPEEADAFLDAVLN